MYIVVCPPIDINKAVYITNLFKPNRWNKVKIKSGLQTINLCISSLFAVSYRNQRPTHIDNHIDALIITLWLVPVSFSREMARLKR